MGALRAYAALRVDRRQVEALKSGDLTTLCCKKQIWRAHFLYVERENSNFDIIFIWNTGNGEDGEAVDIQEEDEESWMISYSLADKRLLVTMLHEPTIEAPPAHAGLLKS